VTDPGPASRPIGLVVNPYAGIGGRVGLKGSDGSEVRRRALELGASAEAPGRAARFVVALAALEPAVRLATAAGPMGEAIAREAGLVPLVVGESRGAATDAEDTRRAARAMRDLGVSVIVFVGGDGTARDVLDAVGQGVPVLGVAAGVKMYSAAFAVGPERAAALVADFERGGVALQEAEVLDLDEEAYRAGRVSPALHGYLRVPYRRESIQGSKEPSPAGEEDAARGIAAEVVERMADGRAYILGPGTTTRAIAHRLGLAKTLVGVDVMRDRKVVVADAWEADLLRIVSDAPAVVVVAPIGGQGFILGRGNLQISPAVLSRVGAANVLVVATPAKLAGLGGRPLRVDTGDLEVDRSLAGHAHVITGHRELALYRVA
jgi:predicted polyphosphate/ATP-dependent NAD kinase